MTFFQFARNLFRIGAEYYQILRLEQLLAPLVEHKIEREAMRIQSAGALNSAFLARRKRLWEEIEREMKKGVSSEQVLGILLRE